MSEPLDFANVDSKEKAQALYREGKLEKLFLMPLEFGGQDVPQNTLYVPRGTVKRKELIDLESVQGLIEQQRVSKYSAHAGYEGKSVVSNAITITVSEPETFRFELNLWGTALKKEEGRWDEV